MQCHIYMVSTRLTVATGSKAMPCVLVLHFRSCVVKPSFDCSEMCREHILERKRREYRDMVPQYYDIQAAERSAEDDTALQQVRQPLHMLTLCNTHCFSIPVRSRHWRQRSLLPRHASSAFARPPPTNHITTQQIRPPVIG